MKEQTEKIFRAIGDVGDDLIERADRPVRKHAQVWVKWAALAACCALVIGAAAFIVPMFHAGSSAPETASLSVDAAPAPQLHREDRGHRRRDRGAPRGPSSIVGDVVGEDHEPASRDLDARPLPQVVLEDVGGDDSR